jgi:hypothetical protein
MTVFMHGILELARQAKNPDLDMRYGQLWASKGHLCCALDKET